MPEFWYCARIWRALQPQFDDTNPEKESIEYINSIRRDVEWLGFKWHSNPSASDYFGQLYDYAVQLIKQGDAYVDSQTADEIRSNRGTLTEPGIAGLIVTARRNKT